MLQWILPTVALVVIILFTLISYKRDILTKEENKRLDEDIRELLERCKQCAKNN